MRSYPFCRRRTVKPFSLRTGALPVVAAMFLAAALAVAQAKPAMELLETKQSATQSTLTIVGQVKNISTREVSGVTVFCDLADASGKKIKTAQGHLEVDPLPPNKVSGFTITTPYDAQIKRYNVRFTQMFGGPLLMNDSRKH